MKNFKISVIISIRIVSSRRDLFHRLEFCFRKEAQDVEYIIVDDGSLQEDAERLKKRSDELGYKYISTDVSIDSPFNLARARNLGARAATGKYVLFLDVDLLVYPGFYDDLQTEIELFDMAHNSDIFLMLPVVYFNEKGLEQYNHTNDRLKKHFASQILLGGKFDLIEKYSYGTSCILVDRLYYLSIGGQDERYEGWGYEDYDFTTKMMKLSSLFPTPANFESMKGNFMTINQYSGWKAEYRLYGMWMARKGIYLYHVPHEIDSSYHNNKNENLQLLEKSLSTDFSNSFLQTIEPDCEKSLLLSANPFCCDYKLNAIVGQYEILNTSNITQWEEILNYFESNDFTQIVFPNPYGNSMLLELYNYCRSHNFKYIVSERGALPGSVYHDKNGFLFDSSSYELNKWNFPLSRDQELEAKKYISTLEKGEETLESQPQKSMREEVLAKLNINKKVKKKILIIFQTKDDTVIKFFGRDFKTQE
ncbi:MAG: glycosyltransferase, partial [Epsilonproteobacteria bacterium]|nr:glycosyltransferase [Campylobacterota bacterium]